MMELRYYQFPLAHDWNSVISTVWTAFCSQFVRPPPSISKQDVFDVLDSLEEEYGFVSISNQMLNVKVKKSRFTQYFMESEELCLPTQSESIDFHSTASVIQDDKKSKALSESNDSGKGMTLIIEYSIQKTLKPAPKLFTLSCVPLI